MFFFLLFSSIAGRHDSYSSYDSLDKFNYALETLKLSDNGSYFNGNVNNCMLQPKCRQPYVHNEIRKMDSGMLNDGKNTPALPPRPPLPRTSQLSPTTIDKDFEKQQQLSDWYYIKTGPKSPLPTPRSDKTNDIAHSRIQTTDTRTTKTISNNNNNTKEEIYVCKDITKNHLQANNQQHLMKRSDNDNSRFEERVQTTKMDHKNDVDVGQNVYRAIKIPTSCDDIRSMHVPTHHQYASGEPIGKVNYRNISGNVNECLNGKPAQNIPHHSIPLKTPPSPSINHKNGNQQQSHPFYYVEPTQKPTFLSRQDKHNEHSPATMNSQSHHERLIPATAFTSNSNSNLHKLTGMNPQPTERCSNANSNSFEYVNVTSGMPSISASSEITMDEKHRFNSQDRVCSRQTTISSSPSLQTTHQSKVSDSFCFLIISLSCFMLTYEILGQNEMHLLFRDLFEIIYMVKRLYLFFRQKFPCCLIISTSYNKVFVSFLLNNFVESLKNNE